MVVLGAPPLLDFSWKMVRVAYYLRLERRIEHAALSGPCRIDMKNESSNGTIWNPYGWNNEANIFFLDQP